MMSVATKVDTVSISRHHYDDDINNEIFGIHTSSFEHLTQYADKLHLSCN